MRFIKPAWIAHEERVDKDKAPKRKNIYSIHVHPDSSRLATGGLDNKIRIWSTVSFQDETAENNASIPKQLCQLDVHNGAVLCVRWSHSGRWLASSSDDGTAVIWGIDPAGSGRIFGSDVVNIENWRVERRLTGHTEDVSNLAWSNDDTMIATVGIDKVVQIYDGTTFERIARIDKHAGFIKGLCWDPVGQYLATASDDKTIKVWNTKDWSLHSSVSLPFKNSPASFFRRLSWSPDGNHIAAPNAMNNGTVMCTALLKRKVGKDFKSQHSFIGHSDASNVAQFNPCLFKRDTKKEATPDNICNVLALGCKDTTISVWSTSCARPIVVLSGIFDRQVTDLSWSADGFTLYASSWDGTIAVIIFAEGELGVQAPDYVRTAHLKTYEFKSSRVQPSASTTSISKPVNILQPKRPNSKQSTTILTTGKKRITPAFHGSISQNTGESVVPTPFSVPNQLIPRASNPSQNSNSNTKLNAASVSNIRNPSSNQQNEAMRRLGLPAAPTSLQTNVQRTSAASKSAGVFAAALENPLEPHTKTSLLGRQFLDRFARDNDRQNGTSYSIPAKRPAAEELSSQAKSRSRTLLRQSNGNSDSPLKSMRSDSPAPMRRRAILELLPVQNHLKVREIQGDDNSNLLSARNKIDASVVTLSDSLNHKIWINQTNSPVITLAANRVGSAVSCKDGTLICWSPMGCRTWSSVLAAPAVRIVFEGHWLCALLPTGEVHVWDLKLRVAKRNIPPIGHLLTGPQTALRDLKLRPNGVPLLVLSTSSVYALDEINGFWSEITGELWAASSTWDSRARLSRTRGVLACLEAEVNEILMSSPGLSLPWESNRNESADVMIAQAFAHLESRMQACIILDSPSEYKAHLISYAKLLAEEGSRGKAEELFRYLCGPIYFKTNLQNSDPYAWSPVLLGYQKRELLKDVLTVVKSSSRSLSKLSSEWLEILRKLND